MDGWKVGMWCRYVNAGSMLVLKAAEYSLYGDQRYRGKRIPPYSTACASDILLYRIITGVQIPHTLFHVLQLDLDDGVASKFLARQIQG